MSHQPATSAQLHMQTMTTGGVQYSIYPSLESASRYSSPGVLSSRVGVSGDSFSGLQRATAYSLPGRQPQELRGLGPDMLQEQQLPAVQLGDLQTGPPTQPSAAGYARQVYHLQADHQRAATGQGPMASSYVSASQTQSHLSAQGRYHQQQRSPEVGSSSGHRQYPEQFPATHRPHAQMARGLSTTPSPYIGSSQASFVPPGVQDVGYSMSDPGTVPPSAEASIGDRGNISADVKDEKQGSTLADTRSTQDDPPGSGSRVRRDKVGKLIDQLRTVVAPTQQSARTHYAYGPDQRPKYAVLMDAINLIQDLKTQVSALTGYLTQVQNMQSVHGEQFIFTEAGAELRQEGSALLKRLGVQAGGPTSVQAALEQILDVHRRDSKQQQAPGQDTQPSSGPPPVNPELLPTIQVVAEGQIIHVSILAKQTEDILLDVVLALQNANLEVKRGNVESKLLNISHLQDLVFISLKASPTRVIPLSGGMSFTQFVAERIQHSLFNAIGRLIYTNHMFPDNP